MKSNDLITEKKIRLGVVGGLGPETCFKFSLNVNNKFRTISGDQPDLLVENVPVPAEIERRIINGQTPTEMCDLLIEAVERLNAAEVDFIVIPCNTVHVFIDELREHSAVPILSIIEECAKDCSKRGLKKVGLLASETTIKTGLHENMLRKVGIDSVKPEAKFQSTINRIIVNIIHNKATEKDKQFLLSIIEKFKEQGAEAVILACTDLPLLVSNEDSCLPIIDTCLILENAAVKGLVEGQSREIAAMAVA